MTVPEKEKMRDLERQIAEAQANAVFREQRIKELETMLTECNNHLGDTGTLSEADEREMVA